MKKPIKSPKIRRTCGQLKTSDFVKIYRKQPKTSQNSLFSAAFGRSEVIRTPDLLVPNQALYQAEPHPESLDLYEIIGSFIASSYRAPIRGSKKNSVVHCFSPATSWKTCHLRYRASEGTVMTGCLRGRTRKSCGRLLSDIKSFAILPTSLLSLRQNNSLDCFALFTTKLSHTPKYTAYG